MKINTMGVLGNCNTPIDLNKLNSFGILFRLNKSQSQGYVKVIDNITACIYKTGKIQIYGIKKISDVSTIWEKLLSKIKVSVDISHADKMPVVKFMVASDTYSHQLNLEELAHIFCKENIEYEPEQFPGLIWKTDLGTFILFTSGNMIITGPSTEELMQASINLMKHRLDVELL